MHANIPSEEFLQNYPQTIRALIANTTRDFHFPIAVVLPSDGGQWSTEVTNGIYEDLLNWAPLKLMGSGYRKLSTSDRWDVYKVTFWVTSIRYSSDIGILVFVEVLSPTELLTFQSDLGER